MKHAHLFSEIEQLIPALPGWCDVNKASQLAATVLALRPNLVVEIGVFGGRSLLPMAMACKVNDHGKVLAIDPWNAEAATAGYEGENKEWWAKLDYADIYRGFMEQVADLGVSRRIEVLRAKSDHVDVPSSIDILHIDGQHTEQALRDAERFAPQVVHGGFCFTDDDDWIGGGPAAACKRILEFGFVPRYKCGTGTAFQRVR